MAASEFTVTPPNPTPPTNFGFVGSTPPNPLNYADEVYGDPDNGMWWGEETPGSAPPPYFDDGSAGSLTEFVSAHVALDEGGTSVDHEGRGSETVVTATSTNPGPYGQLVTFSCMGNYTSTPNASHPSSDSDTPASAPTITGLLPLAPTTGGGTAMLTVNGTNFKNGAVVLINDVPYATQYNSATQLKVLNAPLRTTAGNTGIKVRVGATTTAATNWVFA